jgi:hypothetical protein
MLVSSDDTQTPSEAGAAGGAVWVDAPAIATVAVGLIGSVLKTLWFRHGPLEGRFPTSAMTLMGCRQRTRFLERKKAKDEQIL